MRLDLSKLIRFLAFSMISSASTAALYDRGGGLLYDDVLNLTWLQDANYAKTSGYDNDGNLTWSGAMNFASNLSYYDSVREVTYDDWRLPHALPVNSENYNGKFSFDGSTDEAYNITSTQSELAYMYYVNLGLKGYYTVNGDIRADFGPQKNGNFGTANVGPVLNLRSTVYWTESEYLPHPELNAWMFDPYWGNQNFYSKWDQLAVWLVRDGDVANNADRLQVLTAIPEPNVSSMFILGLVPVIVIGYRKRKIF